MRTDAYTKCRGVGRIGANFTSACTPKSTPKISPMLKPISKKILKGLEEIRKATCETTEGENG